MSYANTKKNVDTKTLRTLEALNEAGLLPSEKIETLRPLTSRYSIGVTSHIAKQIVHIDDPVAKQFLPSIEEQKILPQELLDPIGDHPHAPLKALVHRHTNRVLLKPTQACEVYCRFCFRREMVGPNGDTLTHEDVENALDYIAQNPEISEVILTGGDPLVLSPERLKNIMMRLQTMPHIRWIRIHTRVPIVAPQKMTAEMIDAMRGIKPVLMAIHMNHANEMTTEAGSALSRLAHAGIVLLGQSVLLKGVNDNVSALVTLFETMMANRIKPYYLHHPDLTAGTSHFRMDFSEGMALMNQIRERLSGVCVPQYTIDIPGGVHKIPVSNDYVQKSDSGKSGTWVIKDPMGGMYLYEDLLEA